MFVTWTHRRGDLSYQIDAARPFSPLGAPGDRVWFREAWGMLLMHINGVGSGRCLRYRATYENDCDLSNPPRWRSSRTMPRHLSRITRDIVSVRVEWVQEISEAEAAASGTWEWWDSLDRKTQHDLSANGSSTVATFRDMWNRAHGHGAFEKNPLVWVYDFKEVE